MDYGKSSHKDCISAEKEGTSALKFDTLSQTTRINPEQAFDTRLPYSIKWLYLSF